MLIQCTKKLLDKLQIDDRPESPNDNYHPLYSWHANVMTFDDKDCIVLVNDETYFAIFYDGFTAQDFKRFEEIVTDGIRQVLFDHCIDKAIIEEYIKRYQPFNYTKTRNRSYVSHLIVLGEDIKYINNGHETDPHHVQPIVSRFINKIPYQKNHQVIFPKVAFIQALEKEFKRPIFKTKAVTLQVSLEQGQHKLWRELIVPLRFTFRDLHDILQIAFNWSNTYLHEFYVKNDKGESTLLIGTQWTETHASNGEKTLLEANTYLEDILTEYTTIHYVYDLRNYWDHQIVVQEIMDDYHRNIPICIDGEGIIDSASIEDAEYIDPDILDEDDEFLFEEVNQRFAHYFGS